MGKGMGEMAMELTPEQAEFVEKNMNLVYKFVSKFCNGTEDRDDLISDASLGLCKAAMFFDPSKGFAFSSYAYTCMMNSCCMGIKERQKQTSLNSISLDESVYTDDGSEARIENIVGSEDDTSAIEISADMEEFLENAATLDLRILLSLAQGYTQAKIADELGFTRSYINARVVRLRQAFAEGRRPKASACKRDPEQDPLLRREILSIARIKS